MNRKCSSCGKTKDVSHFYGSSHYHCKECDKKYASEYRKKNPQKARSATKRWQLKFPERKKESSRNWHKNLRNDALSAYGDSCACCGEGTREFMTIDHMDGSGNKHRKLVGGSTGFHSWLKKNGYPKGFQILCFNCNMAKAIYGVCPHKKRIDEVQSVR